MKAVLFSQRSSCAASGEQPPVPRIPRPLPYQPQRLGDGGVAYRVRTGCSRNCGRAPVDAASRTVRSSKLTRVAVSSTRFARLKIRSFDGASHAPRVSDTAAANCERKTRRFVIPGIGDDNTRRYCPQRSRRRHVRTDRGGHGRHHVAEVPMVIILAASVDRER